MKKLILLLLLIPFLGLGQGTITNPWVRNGNTSGNNTDYLGTRDNRSLRFNTNSLLRTKIDSLGQFKHYGNFFIDKSNGVNSLNPMKFQIAELGALPGFLMMHSAQNIPDLTNYTFIWDSTITGINGPKSLLLRQGSGIFMQIQGRQVNGVDGTTLSGNGIVTFLSCAATTTSAINNGIPFMKHGSLTYSLSGGTVPSLQWWQIQAPNIKSSTPTTVTDWYYWRLQNPTFDAGVTITNNWGLRNDGNSTTGGSSYLGGQVVASPTAIVTLAAGNTTRTAVQMTNQNAPSSPQAGSFWYGTTLGFQHTGNMWTSGNATVVGTHSVGSTSTMNGITNTGNITTSGTFSAGSTGTIGAGLRVVGALSVTTTGSVGTTFTVGGASTMNGIANTGSITTSTTFSCGTTATLGGQAQTNGITNTGTMSCSGASTLTGAVTVGNNLTSSAGIWSTSKTSFIGYAAGSGSTVTQASSRTTAVTINAATGIITLVSAAGTTSWQTFTVNNSSLGATDMVIMNQIAGSDKYMWFIQHTSNLAFTITFATTGGTTVEQPSFQFAIIKGTNN